MSEVILKKEMKIIINKEASRRTRITLALLEHRFIYEC